MLITRRFAYLKVLVLAAAWLLMTQGGIATSGQEVVVSNLKLAGQVELEADEWLVVSVSEGAEAEDLNQDGDTTDEVPHVHKPQNRGDTKSRTRGAYFVAVARDMGCHGGLAVKSTARCRTRLGPLRGARVPQRFPRFEWRRRRPGRCSSRV